MANRRVLHVFCALPPRTRRLCTSKFQLRRCIWSDFLLSYFLIRYINWHIVVSLHLNICDDLIRYTCVIPLPVAALMFFVGCVSLWTDKVVMLVIRCKEHTSWAHRSIFSHPFAHGTENETPGQSIQRGCGWYYKRHFKAILDSKWLICTKQDFLLQTDTSVWVQRSVPSQYFALPVYFVTVRINLDTFN